MVKIIEKLKEQLRLQLPGAFAHEAMRAKPVGSVLPTFNHKAPPKPGSVLILIYEINGMYHIPFIKRPDYMGAHSGQVSFPGGKAEPGEGDIETALREANEEIGINTNSITVVGKLSNFFVFPSNFMITPVVAVANELPSFEPDPHEVERIIHGRVNDLLPEDAIKDKEILAANVYRMMAPHFEIDGEIVWGATAMMLNEFRLVWKSIQ